MDVTTAAAHFAEANRLYREGNLHRARDVAEKILLSLSSSTAQLDTQQNNTAANTDRRTAVSSSSSPPLAPVPSSTLFHASLRHHQLFGNILLLLSSVYTAVGDFAESERLLVTCEGYWKDHLSSSGSGAAKGDARAAVSRVRSEGLAGVAYNRAVLRLEQLDHADAPARPKPQPTQVSSDGGYTASFSSPHHPLRTADEEQEEERRQHRQAVATEVLRKFLYDARDRLAHTLGSQRGLLADVHHSIGVCHYCCRDYVAALEAWQQSSAIRVHVRSCRAGQLADAESSEEELKLALTLEHIAHVYQLFEGKGVAALKMYDTVATTRERLLGPMHPLYARTLLEKAVLAEKLGRRRLVRALVDACHRITCQNGSGCDSAFVAEVERWTAYVHSSSPSQPG